MTRIAFVGTAIGFACLAGLSPAAAQTPATPLASTFSELSQHLRVGDEVQVSTTENVKLQGRLVGLSADALDVEVDRERHHVSELSVTEVDKVKESHWLRKGLIIGALVGFGTSLTLSAALCDAPSCDTAGPVAIGTGMFAGIGAGAGAVIDLTRRGSTVAYRRETRSVTWGVVPLLAPGRTGAALSLAF